MGKWYQLTDVSGTDVYVDGSADQLIAALLSSGVRFVDKDGSTLKVREVKREQPPR